MSELIFVITPAAKCRSRWQGCEVVKYSMNKQANLVGNSCSPGLPQLRPPIRLLLCSSPDSRSLRHLRLISLTPGFSGVYLAAVGGKTVSTVSSCARKLLRQLPLVNSSSTPLKRGVNEKIRGKL